MANPVTGGCMCGAVRYEYAADPLMSVNCYCRDCQQATGSAMAPVLIVGKSTFRVTRGEPRFYTVKGDSGNEVSRGFCPNCGSPMLTLISAMPEVVGIKASSLDDPSLFKPAMNIFVPSAQPWAPISRDIPGFPGMPPE